jgi:hypothetical protein
MPTNHNLTSAPNLYVGGGYDPAIAALNGGAKGAPFHPLTRLSLGTPALADDNALIDAATSTNMPNNSTKTYTPATDGTAPLDNTDSPAPITITTATGGSALVWPLDVPRNIVSTNAKTGTTAAITVLISGYDLYKRPMTELQTLAATATSVTVAGKKAFKYVASIAIASAANATTNSLVVGTGSALGLPYALKSLGDVFKASLGGVQELINVASNATVVAADATSPATTVTGDARGTITFTGALNGTKEAVVWAYIAGRNTAVGLAGVSQV